jgi:acyl carrier protein
MLVARHREPTSGREASRERHRADMGAVESRVRRIVADRLGLAPDELLPDTSLADDLAVDSLDLLEIAIAIEADTGVSIAERWLESVRTYGDLAALVTTLVARRRVPQTPPAPAALTRVVVADRATIQRMAFLTPYAVETITDDAIAAGPGARLEVELRGVAGAGVLERVRVLFARLPPRGIRVLVSADADARLAGRRPAA